VVVNRGQKNTSLYLFYAKKIQAKRKKIQAKRKKIQAKKEKRNKVSAEKEQGKRTIT